MVVMHVQAHQCSTSAVKRAARDNRHVHAFGWSGSSHLPCYIRYLMPVLPATVHAVMHAAVPTWRYLPGPRLQPNDGPTRSSITLPTDSIGPFHVPSSRPASRLLAHFNLLASTSSSSLYSPSSPPPQLWWLSSTLHNELDGCFRHPVSGIA